jgi:arsenate reductase|tara:strand:+ start:348 stop:704 length:357 start_codon:yes stop_codon:yes gene_type:complete
LKKITIYHNPRCSKSREVLFHLEEEGYECQVIRYLETPFTKKTLQEVLKKINLLPSQLVRKGEADWKSISNKTTITEDEILTLLVNYPKVIERPIVTIASSGALARPFENLVLFLKEN